LLVDSGVWIDFFNGARGDDVDCLVQAIDRGDRVIVGDLVLIEVLQGFRHDREFATAQRLLAKFETAGLVNHDVAMLGATYLRQLRSRGITVRKTIDTLLATKCIMEGWPLLFRDRDFEPFVEHCGLQSALHA
jgi:predicted nucleic acid-binding protein